MALWCLPVCFFASMDIVGRMQINEVIHWIQLWVLNQKLIVDNFDSPQLRATTR